MGALRHQDVWYGEYREFHFKIVHHGINEEFNPLGTWCYYIYVPVNRIRPEDAKKMFPVEADSERDSIFNRKGQKPYRRFDDSQLPDLELHCGCTHYEVDSAHGEPIAEIGCDYAHYYDEGIEYNVDYVEQDAQKSIDALWSLFPNMLHRCSYNGGWYNENEGHQTPSGWISLDAEKAIEERKNKETSTGGTQ